MFAFEYGLSGVLVLCGLLPSSSFLLVAAMDSSDCSFSSLCCSRKDCSSARKETIRSSAFSFLEGFSSVLARSAYWSRVREKAVRDAVIWPRREGVRGVTEGVERSRFKEVDCLRAVLKREFWRLLDSCKGELRASLSSPW